MMNMILAIFAGGGAGALARHFTGVAVGRMLGDALPYGTLMANVAGCFLIGALAEGLALKWQMPLEIRGLLVTGFLGGFTTFSAFSLEFYKLVQAGQMLQAAVYVLASMVLSLLAVFVGVYLMRGVLG